MTQESLGKALGYTPDSHGGCATIARWESGAREPNLGQIAAIVAATGRAVRFDVETDAGDKCAVSLALSGRSATAA